MHRFSAFWHMRLPHRLQGQKVKSQSHGVGAYCGGDLAAQLVTVDHKILSRLVALALRGIYRSACNVYCDQSAKIWDPRGHPHYRQLYALARHTESWMQCVSNGSPFTA